MRMALFISRTSFDPRPRTEGDRAVSCTATARNSFDPRPRTEGDTRLSNILIQEDKEPTGREPLPLMAPADTIKRSSADKKPNRSGLQASCERYIELCPLWVRAAG